MRAHRIVHPGQAGTTNGPPAPSSRQDYHLHAGGAQSGGRGRGDSLAERDVHGLQVRANPRQGQEGRVGDALAPDRFHLAWCGAHKARDNTIAARVRVGAGKTDTVRCESSQEGSFLSSSLPLSCVRRTRDDK